MHPAPARHRIVKRRCVDCVLGVAHVIRAGRVVVGPGQTLRHDQTGARNDFKSAENASKADCLHTQRDGVRFELPQSLVIELASVASSACNVGICSVSRLIGHVFTCSSRVTPLTFLGLQHVVQQTYSQLSELQPRTVRVRSGLSRRREQRELRGASPHTVIRCTNHIMRPIHEADLRIAS